MLLLKFRVTSDGYLMEFLLNVCWLLLIAPAFWYWARQRGHAESHRCLITLACLLALLFPVISVSDDLQAMRQEMEDSAPIKRGLRQAGVESVKSQDPLSHPLAQPVVAITVVAKQELGRVILPAIVLPVQASRNTTSDRAPPLFWVG